MKIGRRSIEITNANKILFPQSHITKSELISYYQTIGPTMIPHTKKRLLSLQRFPNGIDQEGFFQKDAGDYFPSWISRVPVHKQNNDIVKYITADSTATLVYLANQACITPHVWLSYTDKLEYPDRIVFDLDPGQKCKFIDVINAAKKLHTLLTSLDLPVFYMLTGSRGVHVVVPIKRLYTFEITRKFAHDIALLLAEENPQKITVDVHKSKRDKKVFIDWLRNAYGATVVAPYATRALEHAPVATPITYGELMQNTKSSQKYTIKNIHQRLTNVGDIWKNIKKCSVTLKGAQKKLLTLLEQKTN